MKLVYQMWIENSRQQMILLVVAKSTALTTENIVPILKKAGFVTNEDIRGIVGSEIDKRKLVAKEDLKGLATEVGVKSAILASERRLKLRMGKIRNDLAGRIANLAINTPSQKEFDELKATVAKSKYY